jgi:hypothetical protein
MQLKVPDSKSVRKAVSKTPNTQSDSKHGINDFKAS